MTMLQESLQVLFERDLKKLKFEIESYENESDIWKTDQSISNSAGNICLHLIGNLNGFVGAQFGNTGFVRQRDLEFSSKSIPRVDLLKEIDQTMLMLDETLLKVTNEQLEAEYPILVFKQNTSTYYFLIHLTTHLAYHLGQINYHRRLLDE
jgi:uncharacterized damage-inducible protein DinB